MSRDFSPSELVSIFLNRNIDPDREFLAVAGTETGYVLAWSLTNGEYLILVGNDNNDDRHCTVTDDADDFADLARFLISKDAFGLNYILQIANVRGPEYIEAASEDAQGPFYIVKTRYWFDQKTSEAVEDEDRRPRRFATYSEAKAWIDAEKQKPYKKVPAEIDLPSYVIVSLPD
jgi:hypothetical protein